MALTTFEGYVHFSTPKAILFQSHYWEAPMWLPLSQIFAESEVDSMETVVKVKDWLVGKKGLLEFTPYTVEEIERMNG